MSEAYAAAGVNLELGDDLSKTLYEISKMTWENRAGKYGEPVAELDSFSGLRSMPIAPLLEVPDAKNIVTMMADDGVGTKVEVAERMLQHSTVAFDLLAMVCDDAAIKGFEPCAVTTTLDVHKLKPDMRREMNDLAYGYFNAAKAARVALVNGEVAELGDLIGGFGNENRFKYTWNATVLAAGHRSRLLDGSLIQPGDALVAFREQGFRSNGLSLARKALLGAFGESWQHARAFGDEQTPIRTWGELVLRPSVIYSPILVDAVGGYDLRTEPQAKVFGAAHITGGGIPGKLGRLLEATGFGADIGEPFEPSPAMKELQAWADVGDHEIYKVWNMGQGMIVATNETDKLITLAAEHGVAAKVVGEVTEQPGIVIRSAGAVARPGKKLVYDAN